MTDIVNLARQCAESVLLARITPLIGKDTAGKIPKLKQRVAAIRAGNLDSAPEVQSAIEMANRLGAEK